jgi:hypothetical protein
MPVSPQMYVETESRVRSGGAISRIVLAAYVRTGGVVRVDGRMERGRPFRIPQTALSGVLTVYEDSREFKNGAGGGGGERPRLR